MLKGIAAGLALFLIIVAGCSSSSGSTESICDNPKSKCPNDKPLDSAECKKQIGDSHCGKAWEKLFKCIGEHQTCLSDGTTDQTVSQRECAAEFSGVQTCAVGDGG
jgi:hypothetical protein